MRDFIMIVEGPRTSLPLQKGALNTVRGNYGALLAVMRPEDYLSLTTENKAHRDEIDTHPFTSLDTYSAKTPPPETEHGAIFHKTMYNMPSLIISYPSGQVLNHEGRHRAAMVIRAGGTKFPVAIYFRSEFVFTVSYIEYTGNDDEEGTEKVETFDNVDAARQRRKELEKLSHDYDAPVYIGRVEMDHSGGVTLRGHPGRSERWNYVPWDPKDVPAVFKGQFDPSVTVPTSRMAIAAVKKAAR